MKEPTQPTQPTKEQQSKMDAASDAAIEAMGAHNLSDVEAITVAVGLVCAVALATGKPQAMVLEAIRRCWPDVEKSASDAGVFL